MTQAPHEAREGDQVRQWIHRKELIDEEAPPVSDEYFPSTAFRMNSRWAQPCDAFQITKGENTASASAAAA